GPVLLGGVASVGQEERTCMGQAEGAVAQLLRVTFQARSRAFNQMATADLTLTEKQALLHRSERRVSRAVRLLQQRVRTWCSEADFSAIYGRDIRTFLQGVAARGDCLTGWTYAQNEVLCPPSTCGNGIKEPGEECDDGNDSDADGCRSDC